MMGTKTYNLACQGHPEDTMGKPIVDDDPIASSGHEPDAWVDAGVEAAYSFDLLADAKTLNEQAEAYTRLRNAMSDLKSWLPGRDDHGNMPWDRDDDTYYERRAQALKDGVKTPPPPPAD